VAGGPAGIVATNVFHRAVAFAPVACAQMPTGLPGRGCSQTRLWRARPDGPVLLAAAGEQLRAGDLLITRSVVQVRVAAGDEVVADLGALVSVGLSLT
jgi:hypothetical protein